MFTYTHTHTHPEEFRSHLSVHIFKANSKYVICRDMVASFSVAQNPSSGRKPHHKAIPIGLISSLQGTSFPLFLLSNYNTQPKLSKEAKFRVWNLNWDCCAVITMGTHHLLLLQRNSPSLEPNCFILYEVLGWKGYHICAA